ncbi:MAG: glycerate kinase [Verrucomicrobiales bacterium]
MNVLVASDKFKGSMSAMEACRAIAEGLRAGDSSNGHDIRCLPVADGGDGLARTLTDAQDGEWIEAEVAGPLGEAATAGYGLVDEGRTAVVEMAAASGIALLEDRPKDPWRASTRGTGELILHARGRGASRLVLGIGGSATNDGGVGMASALGFRFLDASGDPVLDLPAELLSVRKMLPPEHSDLPATTVACDVVNPLLGPEGCTRIYGPQKGIAPEEMERHEQRLQHLVALAGETGKEFAARPGAGAAGGLGFGSLVFLGAELLPGFDLVADRLGLERHVAWADLVVTGEGKLDRQSLSGKAPCGVAGLARRLGKATAAFCGVLEDPALESHFGPIREIRQPILTLAENMARGPELLRREAEAAAPAIFSSAARALH